jgi:pimeloyl-CoA synthetase
VSWRATAAAASCGSHESVLRTSSNEVDEFWDNAGPVILDVEWGARYGGRCRKTRGRRVRLVGEAAWVRALM